MLIATTSNRALLAAVALSASCVAPATSIEVRLGTDAPPDSVVTVSVWANDRNVEPSADAALMRRLPLRASDTFAGSFAVVPRAGDARDARVFVRIEAEVARDGLSQSFVRTLSTRFIPLRSPQLTVFLSTRCLARRSDCASVTGIACTQSVYCEERGTTCGSSGECVTREVDPTLDGDASFEERAAIDDGASDASALDASDDGDAPDGASCDAGLRVCNGVCVDTARSSANCGACGRSCAALPRVGAAACSNGACVIQACAGGYDDCDNNPSNGCESAVGQRTGLCRCGLRCNSTFVCTNSARSCCDLSQSCANNAACNASQRCILISGASVKHCCY